MAQPVFPAPSKTLGKSMAFAVLIGAALALSACGKRPSINDLEPPKQKVETSASDLTPQATIDGAKDGPEPVAKKRPEKRFFLDALL